MLLVQALQEIKAIAAIIERKEKIRKTVLAGVTFHMEVKASVEERKIKSVGATVDEKEKAKASSSFAGMISERRKFINAAVPDMLVVCPLLD